MTEAIKVGDRVLVQQQALGHVERIESVDGKTLVHVQLDKLPGISSQPFFLEDVELANEE
jgi:hypothetical protein